MTMTATQVLNETERLLKTEGWKRLDLYSCIVARAHQACGLRFGYVVQKDHPHLHDAMNAVREHLGVTSVTVWNDEPYRTFDEVLAAIEGGRQVLAAAPQP